MNLSVAQAKHIRELVGATQIVILARDGNEMTVATHGKTKRDGVVAAKDGNTLKKLIGFPDSACHDSPLPRICKNCTFYKPDYGTWCFNGWSGDGSRGHCLVEPSITRVGAEQGCRHFEPK